MSIEIKFHPKSSPTRDELKRLLLEFGFAPATHLWNWPDGSIHFHWFNEVDYQSFDGVEATIFPPSDDVKAKLGDCTWALHTRTRASASPADKEHQNTIVRQARARFQGNFYNDWYGRNRYTQVKPDRRDATARGIYLAYEHVTSEIRDVQYALPDPQKGFEELVGTQLENLSQVDPTRVLYNALLPFSVAAFEHFFSRCFKILLHYDPHARNRISSQNRKIELADALAIQSGAKTIEDIIANWYSFQNIGSVQQAFSNWLDIDIWKILRQKKKVGRRLQFLDVQFKSLVDMRHGVIHRFTIDRQMRKQDIQELFHVVLTIIDTFVDHLEQTEGKSIRD